MNWRELPLWRRIGTIPMTIIVIIIFLFIVGSNLEKPPEKTGTKKTAVVADTINQKIKR
ncbi:MAG: hypothetical protein PHT40_03755 [Patescibacteria group bacterium]|nr:hypothetical protein [Patescibacteria group bacterium]